MSDKTLAERMGFTCYSGEKEEWLWREAERLDDENRANDAEIAALKQQVDQLEAEKDQIQSDLIRRKHNDDIWSEQWAKREVEYAQAIQLLKARIVELEERLQSEQRADAEVQEIVAKYEADSLAAEARVRELEDQQRWIPVRTFSMPNNGQMVNAWNGVNVIWSRYIEGRGFDYASGGMASSITHWRPLPAPPERKEQP